MSKKVSLLVLASGLGLVGLSLVQVYLVKNTFRHKQDAFWNTTTTVASKVEDTPGMAELTATWQKELRHILIDYRKGGLTKVQVVPQLQERLAPLDTAYSGLFARSLPAKQLAYELAFQKRIKSLVLKDSFAADTIFGTSGTESLPFLGDNFPLGDSRKSGQTTSQVSLTYSGEEREAEKQMTYQVVTDNLVSIKQWRRYILREMWGILLASGLIFCFVFGLLFYSIYSLLRQKKITELKTDFINNITHEFKTPLATLGIAIKLLRENAHERGSEVATEAVRIIDRQNRRLVALTDQVTNNTLQGSELTLRLEPVTIGPYLQTVFSDFLLGAANTNVTMRYELDGLNQQVSIDPFYFTTALLNVLENAVKHNPKPVRLSGSVSIEDRLHIHIIDDGRGIAVEHRPYVFDKFYRGGNRDTHDTKGLGLGLYYAKQIILAHGGTIDLISEEGRGSQLIFSLPLH